jgi:hypothetical protein
MAEKTILYFEKPGKGDTDELLKAVGTRAQALSGDLSEGLQAPGVQAVAAKILYRFSQGMKVAVEVALMAADAGLLDMEREIIAIGGTGEGADTAIVVKPAYTRTFPEMEIREIIAKPREA